MEKESERYEEYFDLYDKNRNLIGKKHRRGDKLGDGEYHLVVHVCIFNHKNELLIQQRQPFKKGWPNLWDLTVGGAAIAGEDSQRAAERETREEIGLTINLTNIRPHFTVNFENGFDDYYFITKDISIEELTLQPEEVRAVKWVNKKELLAMQKSGVMIPYYFLDKIFDIKNAYGSILTEQEPIEIKYATEEHLDSWMNLVEIVRWNFPGLETEQLLEEYKNTVRKNIKRRSAICALHHYQVVGILLFSSNRNMLSCLAVHPDYRREGIATRLVNEMLSNLNEEREIIVETFRKEDQKGGAARVFYEHMGFVEGELCTEMNYPLQRFTKMPK
jgi:isopentenyldiphosphate isomerase/ribosomal protein S18 acetylase RimI-like enzyme